ncbi:MAG: mannose-1-phosphate guanylyltransferase/mannose-6-phosphate isomerase [Desulfovibrionales bacterium]
MIIPIILSGGSGTRLWPMSRQLYPKQLLPLAGERTMLQETVSRLKGMEEIGRPVVICNEDHRFMVAEQLRQIGVDPQAIILEPKGRNTAPAAAVGALHALASDPKAVLLVLPADHIIRDVDAFSTAVRQGVQAAREGRLITFGIVPTGPETGYGYIKKGKWQAASGKGEEGKQPAASSEQGRGGEEAQSSTPKAESKTEEGNSGVFAVERFVEKPDLVTAGEYVQSGEYLWNSGMFVFQGDRFIEELERFAPEMVACSREALEKGARDLDFIRLDKDAFEACPSDSIDYAVMEKTDAAAVIPLNAGWNDIGSWSALWDVGTADGNHNVCLGDVITHGSKGCYLHSTSRLVAAVGLEDQVVVETKDAVLVASKGQVQDVKAIVEMLKKKARDEAVVHSRVYRPWGDYECIDQAARFQVKRITVKPGEVLSLQMHHHRAEHWVVVKGTARITRGEDVIVLTEDQSTYIPLGTVHRLENPGRIPLELIEVQTGSYLGEDDIVRLEDVYGRTKK